MEVGLVCYDITERLTCTEPLCAVHVRYVIFVDSCINSIIDLLWNYLVEVTSEFIVKFVRVLLIILRVLRRHILLEIHVRLGSFIHYLEE